MLTIRVNSEVNNAKIFFLFLPLRNLMSVGVVFQDAATLISIFFFHFAFKLKFFENALFFAARRNAVDDFWLYDKSKKKAYCHPSRIIHTSFVCSVTQSRKVKEI